MTGSTKPQQQIWFNQCGPPQCPETVWKVSDCQLQDGKPWYCQEFVGQILKWWTLRRRLSGVGCLPCCSCEGQSKPGWPPPLLTSGSEPFCDPWKIWHSDKFHRRRSSKMEPVMDLQWQTVVRSHSLGTCDLSYCRIGLRTGKIWMLSQCLQHWRRAAAGHPLSHLVY